MEKIIGALIMLLISIAFYYSGVDKPPYESGSKKFLYLLSIASSTTAIALMLYGLRSFFVDYLIAEYQRVKKL